MPDGLSPRLAELIGALPFRPDMRVLEIGGGPGAAARAVAARLTAGHILMIDRSATAIRQAQVACREEIASGRLSVRQAAAETFDLKAGEEPFDLAFAFRVGALDGRHPKAGEAALACIGRALRPGAKLFIDGGNPLREIALPHG